jgi:hypothetical protein
VTDAGSFALEVHEAGGIQSWVLPQAKPYRNPCRIVAVVGVWGVHGQPLQAARRPGAGQLQPAAVVAHLPPLVRRRPRDAPAQLEVAVRPGMPPADDRLLPEQRGGTLRLSLSPPPPSSLTFLRHVLC